MSLEISNMIPWFQYTVINVGPIPIQVWGFFVALGMIVSIILIQKYSYSFVGTHSKKIIDLAFWMIIFGIIGARFFHAFFYEPSFFLENPAEIIKLWKGGMSSFGGLFGAGLAFVLLRKKYHVTKENITKVVDLISFSALFGWMVGRIGCVMIHDHLGKRSDSFIAIKYIGGARLETALLEILGLIPLAIIFIFSWYKKRRSGWYISMLFVYYGILRLVLDFYRAEDIVQADARYFGLTPAQYFAILLVIAGIYIFRKKR